MTRYPRLILQLALLCMCLSACAAAQGQATYRNPVLAGDHPDPSVIRVGEDYWATTTTGNWAPHFSILHSRDLVNWEQVSAVFNVAPQWAARDFWAPEITQDRGRFFVYYTARKKGGPLCVAVASADQPEGPYTDHGPLVCQDIGSIDAYAVRDEQGWLYLVWKEDGNSRGEPTPIWAQRLAEEGPPRLVGSRKELLRNDKTTWERHVIEGAYIMRRGNWFYLFYSGNACCGRECNYALGVARSRRLLGPYERNPANPILAANEHWQCPGHGSIVTDELGRNFLLYHSYRKRRDTFSVGRETLLDEVRWNADGWPTINQGRGPSVVAPVPPGPGAASDAEGAVDDLSDDFAAPKLGAAWQWPMFKQQDARVDASDGGRLVLTARGSSDTSSWTGAVLGRRTTSGSYTATTLVNARTLPAGGRAGLALYGWESAAAGIALSAGKIVVWQREQKESRTLASVNAPAAAALYLRMTAIDGESYRFAYSVDGRDWKNLGEPVNGSYIEGAHIALTVGGPPGTSATFDWLRVAPLAQRAAP